MMHHISAGRAETLLMPIDIQVVLVCNILLTYLWNMLYNENIALLMN